MDKKLLIVTLLATLLVPFLVVGVSRAEVVTGDTAVTYQGTITFSVASYVEVDFGPGWNSLIVPGSIKPGTSGIFPVDFDPASTYINVASNTNVNVDIAFGVPTKNSFIQNLRIGPVRGTKGAYSILVNNVSSGFYYRPGPIEAEIVVPSGTRAGIWDESFIICVAISGYVNQYCPAL